ncbi:DGQHR domain-containing protein [Aurantiacibacter rhizosphaerae]|uniref:DGQHR domain-containing protein n=1 Tax=Aurantiacibacter rhizosphaerae TaxID=2691582 RepID=A0A844XAT0_9SPHN|nr:DGQHR domain-containing protein [Aurantiacibacter rhizosphaerae]MWV26635.1 DGQHR domain-containing protein [Aurantiacibacter rhizosphaerae]
MSVLSVVKGQTLSSGTQTIVGALKFREIHDRIRTPWRDARTKEGYQRKPAHSRIAKLMMEIRKGRVDIPTAVLLNAPHPTWEIAYQDRQGNSCAELDLQKYSGDFSVVDGQHRLTALKHLYHEDPERYGNFKIQFVMMLGATKFVELEQFYIVNSTAKSVKTDLAYDLLKQRADHDGLVMTGLIESGQDWKVEAQSLTEMMADDSDIWRRRIQLANEPKNGTTIPSASFVTSLRKFLTYPFIKNLSREKKFELLETYWRGIRSAIKEPFVKPDDYTLLKGIGVWAMHEILPEVIEIIRSNGDQLFDDTNYGPILADMFDDLEGENKEADVVKGADFWLTAPKGGAAGSYSSSAGKRVLISKLLQGLPEPSIE